MQPLHGKISHDFKDALGKPHLPYNQATQRFITNISDGLATAHEGINVYKTDFLQKGMEATGWVFILTLQKFISNPAQKPTHPIIITLEKHSGHIQIISTEVPPSLFYTVTQMTEHYLSQGMHTERASIKIGSLAKAKSKIGNLVHRTSSSLSSMFEQSARNKKLGKSLRVKIKDSVQAIVDSNLSRIITDAISDIELFVDKDIMAFAEEFASNNTVINEEQLSAIRLYNFILNAKGPRARENRKGAIELIKNTASTLPDNTDFWNAIDRGEPCFAALARALNLKSAGTIRHMLAQAGLYKKGIAAFTKQARFLDNIVFQAWPNMSDFKYFEFMQKAAISYGETFSRDPADVLALWVKETGAKKTWQERFLIKFEKLIKSEIKKEQSEISDIYKKQRKQIAYKLSPDERGNESEVNLDILKHITNNSFYSTILKKYMTSVNQISDFKRNIKQSIILPAIILAYDTLGTKVTEPEKTEIEKILIRALWENCPPSEQIEASSYWHSGAVNFGQRFNALTGTFGMAWHSIIDCPIELPNKVWAHPLTSDTALREEADAMTHCVWSYGPSCLGSYSTSFNHIFSLRDGENNRLSTLTITETHEQGRRSFRVSQNKSVKNSTPPSQALKAAEALTKLINSGDIDTNWQLIEKERAEYKARQIDNAVGFDFRDPKIMARVFSLYEPCLPRKILRQSGGTHTGLSEMLKVHDVVKLVISNRAPIAAPVPNATTPALRP